MKLFRRTIPEQRALEAFFFFYSNAVALCRGFSELTAFYRLEQRSPALRTSDLHHLFKIRSLLPSLAWLTLIPHVDLFYLPLFNNCQFPYRRWLINRFWANVICEPLRLFRLKISRKYRDFNWRHLYLLCGTLFSVESLLLSAAGIVWRWETFTYNCGLH